MAEDHSEKQFLVQTKDGNHDVGPSRTYNDAEITVVLMFSIFISVCTSFVGGCSYAYSAPVQSAIISDLDLSTADTMVITDLLYIVGWLAIAFSQGAWSLHLGRLVLGFATALGDYVVPVYIAEISPKNVRGGLVFMSQLMFFSGIAAVLLAGLVTKWRILALIAMLPCMLQLLGIFFIPESPRSLVNVGRDDDYEAALQWLRGNNMDISQEASDIRYLQDYIDGVEDVEGDSFFNVFRRKYAYALTVGLGIMALASFGGTTGILYYGTAIFESAGKLFWHYRELGTMTMALIQLPPSALGVVLMDKFGRSATFDVFRWWPVYGLPFTCIIISFKGTWMAHLLQPLSGLYWHIDIFCIISSWHGRDTICYNVRDIPDKHQGSSRKLSNCSELLE